MPYQDSFYEMYSLELEHLLSSGLSHKLAVSTALALAQTAVHELSSSAPAIPARPNPTFVDHSNSTTPDVLPSTQQTGSLPTGGFQSLRSIIPRATAASSSINCLSTLGSNNNQINTNQVTTPYPATQPTTSPSAGGFQNLGSSTIPVVVTSAPGPVVSLTPNAGIAVALPPPVGQNEPSQDPTQKLSSFFLTPEEKAKNIKQAQAMQALISVTIFCDRDTSGRFDDWVAHLEAALALGDFDEGRKLQLMRSKLYGEAAEEFDTFKLDNPIRARAYADVKTRLMKLFHSMETRSQRSVEFHNMTREPEENMRRYANRMRKAFHLAYPLKGTLDPTTNASREQMMMDRFIEGLQSELQARLKHKEFPSFEKLIDKAELLAMALEEGQTRSRVHAVLIAAREGTAPQPDFSRVMEAL